jgi:diketogulonate reductase-like aldo/keto reductase
LLDTAQVYDTESFVGEALAESSVDAIAGRPSSPSVSKVASKRFILGEPMKSATNSFAGW